jgi:hypothetical protein
LELRQVTNELIQLLSRQRQRFLRLSTVPTLGRLLPQRHRHPHGRRRLGWSVVQAA